METLKLKNLKIEAQANKIANNIACSMQKSIFITPSKEDLAKETLCEVAEMNGYTLVLINNKKEAYLFEGEKQINYSEDPEEIESILAELN